MSKSGVTYSEVRDVCNSLETNLGKGTTSKIGRIKKMPSGKSSSGPEKESGFHGHGRGPSHTGGKK